MGMCRRTATTNGCFPIIVPLFMMLVIYESVVSFALQFTTISTIRRNVLPFSSRGSIPFIPASHCANVPMRLFMDSTDSTFEEDSSDDDDGYENYDNYSVKPNDFQKDATVMRNREQLMQESVSYLLSILQQYKIRIPPTATKPDLIDLIVDYQNPPPKKPREKIDQSGYRNRSIRKENSRTSAGAFDNDSAPKTAPRQGGNRQRTVQSPTNRNRNERTRKRPSTARTDDAYTKRERRRQRNATRNPPSPLKETMKELNSIIPPSKDTVEEAKRLGLQAVDGAASVARSASDEVGRRILKMKRSRSGRRSGTSTNGNGDDDGIQEADWFYVSKDDVWDRSSRQRQDPDFKSRKGSRPRPRPRPSTVSSRTAPLRRRRPPLKRRKSYQDVAGSNVRGSRDFQRKKRLKKRLPKREVSRTAVGEKRDLPALPAKLESVVYVPNLNQNSKSNQNGSLQDMIQIPEEVSDNSQVSGTSGQGDDNNSSLKDEGDADSCVDATVEMKRRIKPVERRGPTRQKRKAANTKKKIYSVYPKDEEAREFEELYGSAAAGAIDTIGEFLADVAGGDYSRGRDNVRQAPRRRGAEQNNTSSSTQDRQRSAQARSSRPNRRYWKDRLAERVDYALGVHEDGKYYKSWEKHLENQKKREINDNDPISIFYDTQKKKKRRNNYSPFWEEDGNFMSLLLGRTPKGKELALNSLFKRDMSISLLLKSTFQTSLAILSYICHWASCRGSLPQPIIVFMLGASAVCAPRRRRLATMVVTLVAMRTLAEALHGYISGNEDWENDIYIDSDETNSNQNRQKDNGRVDTDC